MVSRLDRLFILLDTGSNESVRLAAAKQLGEVQRVQPDDLGYLLDRIKEYSCKPNWETRIAAGHAIRCVLENVPLWPETHVKREHDQPVEGEYPQIASKDVRNFTNTQQILQQFCLDDIVANCPTLVSTNNLTSDDPEPSTSSKSGKARGQKISSQGRKPNKEQLQRQRQLINKELGISIVDSLGVGVKSTDIISNDDLQVDDIANSCHSDSKAKRALQIIRDKTKHYSNLLDYLRGSETTANDSTQVVTDTSEANQWPLSSIVRHFEDGLFHTSWETRHGSAIFLREIVKLHGKCAGKRTNLTRDMNEKLNELWLVDMALKAACLLGLDRFGDYLFDQVIAPVRENAAQLIGCCVAHLPEECTGSLIDILVRMLNSSSWETRHGGMLGLKYSLSVLSKEVMGKIMERIFDPVFKCLADGNDDVSAEAAATLVLVKDIILEKIPEKAPELVKFLWEHLADLDELTSSTSNIILLLASLITASSTQLDTGELNKSIPKLWPLLNHPSTTVRVSTLKALITLSKLQAKPCLLWMPEELMRVTLQLIFQRAILESMEEVHPYIKSAWTQLTSIGTVKTEQQEARLNLLRCTSQYLNYWLCLTLQPSNAPIDRGHCLWLNIGSDGTISGTKPDGEVFIGSFTFNAETIDLQKIQIIECRELGTSLLGTLYSTLTDDHAESQQSKETMQYLSDMFVLYLSTKSANQRMISAWALESWASHQLNIDDSKDLASILPEPIRNQLNTAVRETTLCYDELASAFTRIQQEAREFALALRDAGIVTNFQTGTDKRIIYNLNQIQSMSDLNLEAELTRVTAKKQDASKGTEHDFTMGAPYLSLASKKQTLVKSFQATRASQKALSISTLSSLACALVVWDIIPDKPKHLIDPLLASIEYEREDVIREKSVHYLYELIDTLSLRPVENTDVIQSIYNRLIEALYSSSMTFITDTTNLVGARASLTSDGANPSDEHRVLMLDNIQRKAEQMRTMSRRHSSVCSTTILKRSHSQTSAAEDLGADASESNQSAEIRLKLVGIRSAIGRIVFNFGTRLPVRLPNLWQTIRRGIKDNIDSYASTNDQETRSSKETEIIRDLMVLEAVSENLHHPLRDQLSTLPEYLIRLLSSPDPLMRHQVGRCIGVISKIMFDSIGELIRQKVIPMLEGTSITERCGAIEAIALIIEHLHLDLVPKINMFIVHVLRRMGDQNEQVRLMATHCFGKLLSLMPLSPQNNGEQLAKGGCNSAAPCCLDDDANFIEQLLCPKKLKSHSLQFETRVQLRSYQQEGLNWLAFLNRFNLHGILCDEMGLGKTFMTICMVASDHHTRRTSAKDSDLIPSLIVCPPTLVEHWLLEIEKFVPSATLSSLNPIGYRGNANDRDSIRNRLLKAIKTKTDTIDMKRPINLVVTSYDALRSDIEFFKQIHWNYCVLDEGHIIKNGKTKLSRAVRLLTAEHRLILSGTPVQNNVTELWSLFDFLMPGFLGSERQFNARYARPILQSREPKSSSKELEAGALAMESLHRQVLPFILRRLKQDVLDDLPPKILQDYYCELSPLQKKLYEDFTRGKLCKDVTKRSLNQLSEGEDLKLEVKANSKSHIFQALQYLKSVCNHPKLVLSPKHSQYNEIKKYLETEKASLDDISHSSKLVALRQLLFDCGIGLGDESQQYQQKVAPELESVVNQHRALIFCQLRSMVEIIENDLFKKHLPNITYLRLDGSVPASQRQSTVLRFNNDPSIDVLLLTTHIGGLGLNLTGADTVIFVEQDWNPTKDLQAMDRAHRIGQKKVVNVYRLITKDTLEEKIMSLQKFKTMVSNTVINQDNTGLGTMNVDQLLDLFDGDAADSRLADGRSENRTLPVTQLLPDLWDQQQYETEYDLDNFVSSLGSR